MHRGNLLESFVLALIETLLIARNKTHHILATVFVSLVFRCLDLGQGLDWVQDDVVSGVKLDFLDGQKLANDRRQAVEVVAVKTRLLVEQLDLIQSEVVLNKSGIYANIHMIDIFDSRMENTRDEDPSLLFFHHLHEELGVADLLNSFPIGTLQRLLCDQNQVVFFELLEHWEGGEASLVLDSIYIVSLE